MREQEIPVMRVNILSSASKNLIYNYHDRIAILDRHTVSINVSVKLCSIVLIA